jgi:hypothetical protein
VGSQRVVRKVGVAKGGRFLSENEFHMSSFYVNVSLKLFHTLSCVRQSDFINYLTGYDVSKLVCSSKFVYVLLKLNSTFSLALHLNSANNHNEIHNLKKLIYQKKVLYCISYPYLKEKVDSMSCLNVFCLRLQLLSLISTVLNSFYYENSIFNISTNVNGDNEDNEAMIDKISFAFLLDRFSCLKERISDFPSCYYSLQYDNDHKKWGLYARSVIKKDTVFSIYFGELISTKEMKRRQAVSYDPEVRSSLTRFYSFATLIFFSFFSSFLVFSLPSIFVCFVHHAKGKQLCSFD